MGPIGERKNWEQYSSFLFADAIFSEGGSIPLEMGIWAHFRRVLEGGFGP